MKWLELKKQLLQWPTVNSTLKWNRNTIKYNVLLADITLKNATEQILKHFKEQNIHGPNAVAKLRL